MSNTITLDAPTSSGPPSPRFDAVGSELVVGIVNVSEYQQRNYDTGDPEVWADGNPKMGKVVTGLVVSSTGVSVKDGDAERPLNPGELVSLWCEGGKHFTYRDALKAYGRAVAPGDVMWWGRSEDKPPKNPRHNPQKVYAAEIRAAEAKDGDLADRCIAKYLELKDRPTVDEAPATTGSNAPF